MRVLYVEDSFADADLARRALVRADPDTALTVATSLAGGRAALAGDAAFDVLVLDLNLPDGRGVDLLAEVRSGGCALPVVMLTGSGDPDAVAVAIKAGADDYLIKQGDYLQHLPCRLAEAVRRHHAMASIERRGLVVLYAESQPDEADVVRAHLARHAPHIRLEVVDCAGDARDRLDAARGGRSNPLNLALCH